MLTRSPESPPCRLRFPAADLVIVRSTSRWSSPDEQQRQARQRPSLYSLAAGETNRITFNGSPEPTLGIEVEYQIIDPETGELASGGPAILEAFGQPAYAKPELLQSTVELNVGPCKDVAEACDSLTSRLTALNAVATKLGYGLIAAGTHPTSHWEAQHITDAERYRSLLDRMQWPARRLMIFGVHVHVGVSSGEKAIAISNSLTTFLPPSPGVVGIEPVLARGRHRTGVGAREDLRDTADRRLALSHDQLG